MLRDRQFLVRRHDEEHNPALRPRNERFGLRISRRVENGAEPCKLLLMRARIVGEFSPMPAVNTKASSPPNAAASIPAESPTR